MLDPYDELDTSPVVITVPYESERSNVKSVVRHALFLFKNLVCETDKKARICFWDLSQNYSNDLDRELCGTSYVQAELEPYLEINGWNWEVVKIDTGVGVGGADEIFDINTTMGAKQIKLDHTRYYTIIELSRVDLEHLVKLDSGTVTSGNSTSG
jgi:hypothetical protein